ncbi:DUF881 domain-containing protein [Robertmurraya yapensis]|uniref:DUF881 domain-containing protein n=1 Tax=Bacillus yapensis TaxID=2492960 RepID=A0A431WIW0_9BACI|nr:DUF881 domain-containing protein [Bacillus yapensis]RTR35497.1 DUF881 domain-containing protein [Bacillus yapensis]TKS98298.1 DUF881 domain-containing protein [Bacillus yapensis]
MKLKLKGKYVILSLVSLVLGYMIAFSYQLTRENESDTITNSQWERDIELRNELIAQEENNRELQQELADKQEKLLQMEEELSEQEQGFFNLAEDAEKYRMFLGKVKVKGKGVTVTLADGQYDPNEENINNYLVHEHHVFNVINELYVSGATAIAINGQRLTHNSYIVCNGPVIEVDGNPHPAPFVITAIGDPEVLSAAINITGGVKDMLVNENIEFKLEENQQIVLDPILGS